MTDNQKVTKNKEKKIAIVAEVAKKVEKAKAMVFTNYQGLTHRQLEEMKKELRKADAEYAVTKNTLLKRAISEKVNKEIVEENLSQFEQPTGTLFAYSDPVAPLKVLAKLIKDFEKPQIKFGLLDGKVITDKEVLKLSTLPTRDVLIAQLLGMMQAPIQGLHRALQWNTQKLVLTLNAVAKKKETTA